MGGFHRRCDSGGAEYSALVLSVASEVSGGFPARAEGGVAPDRVSGQTDHLRLARADRLAPHHLVREIFRSSHITQMDLFLKFVCLCVSLYGCSRSEQTLQVLSSDEWMTVVWKQGLYHYKDPFSLSARALRHRGNPSLNITSFIEIHMKSVEV